MSSNPTRSFAKGLVGSTHPLRLAVAALASSAWLLVGTPAHAAGNFLLKTPSVDEKGGEWHVRVRIDLARAPAMMHSPMRFTFSKEAVDERDIMTKGAEPEHHRMVLDTAPKQIVSLDVDFADASGKVFKSTYFEFDLARKDGYFEAGEYQVTLTGPDGGVGGTQKLTLKGDNPPVYRGAMVFDTGTKGPKQKGPRGPRLENVDNGLDGGAQVASNDTPSAGPASTDVAAEGTAPDMVPSSAYKRTAEEEGIQDHPKGCGCVAAGLNEAPLSDPLALGVFTVLGLSVAVARQRRRAPASDA